MSKVRQKGQDKQGRGVSLGVLQQSVYRNDGYHEGGEGRTNEYVNKQKLYGRKAVDEQEIPGYVTVVKRNNEWQTLIRYIDVNIINNGYGLSIIFLLRWNFYNKDRLSKNEESQIERLRHETYLTCRSHTS